MIWELRHEFKVSLLIEIARLPRSTYYYYEKCQNKQDKYGEIKEQILKIYAEKNSRYGYRRILARLKNEGYDFL